MPHLSRRALLAAPAVLALSSLPAAAAGPIGQTRSLRGSGKLVHDGRQSPLSVGMVLNEGDTVRIGAGAIAALFLHTETLIHMGPETQVTLARYLAEAGGTITIGGALVFDRPEAAPKVDLTFQSAFGEIGVRGTRFFFGPSKGKVAVFVDRGRVTVSNAGVSRTLRGGDGVDLARGQPPSEVSQWKAPRIEAAFALVGLKR
ncbi:MAG: FecR domain-containing protein [Paracoccaceae bacterium]